MKLRFSRSLIVGALTWILVSSGPAAHAQFSYDTGQDTMFTHSAASPYWISGQGNFVFQWHPRFPAQYSGLHSFEHVSEQAASEVLTLYTGLQLGPLSEALLDIESAGGSGLSRVLGLAGFTDADAVRSPALTAEPYLARIELRQTIALSGQTVQVERTPLSLLTTVPARRLDIRIGKFSLVDFLDNNSVASDSHMQFLNWTVVNNGAFDYAADTRGYTWGGVLDYEDRRWAIRFVEALVSKRPNGLHLQKNLQNAHSENFELQFRPELIRARSGAIRLLAFTNYANMGSYHDAISLFDEGRTSTPQIDAHPQQTRLKYGFGVNFEQEFSQVLRGFLRVGWNEGQHESWNYTEVDQTIALGGDLRGSAWDRPGDKFGAAFVLNGISPDHRAYLASGGLGFLLGDGKLTYGPEKIAECYYNLPIPIYRGVYGALDLQYVDNPGYNRVRGPVIVPGARLHVEL